MKISFCARDSLLIDKLNFITFLTSPVQSKYPSEQKNEPQFVISSDKLYHAKNISL